MEEIDPLSLALEIIEDLLEQQAMPDDWWKAEVAMLRRLVPVRTTLGWIYPYDR